MKTYIEAAKTAPPVSGVGIPPIVKAMLGAAQKAGQNFTARISNVKLAPYEAGQKFERITFDFDGKPHVAELKGRNRDLVVGMSPEADAGIASRAMLTACCWWAMQSHVRSKFLRARKLKLNKYKLNIG